MRDTNTFFNLRRELEARTFERGAQEAAESLSVWKEIEQEEKERLYEEQVTFAASLLSAQPSEELLTALTTYYRLLLHGIVTPFPRFIAYKCP